MDAPRLWWLLDLYTIYIYSKISTTFHQASIAQLVKRLISNQKAMNSILTEGESISKFHIVFLVIEEQLSMLQFLRFD